MGRYVIVGAGGVGSLLGARLALVDERVVLVGRPSHVERIAADGLQIVEIDQSVTTVRVPAAVKPPDAGAGRYRDPDGQVV